MTISHEDARRAIRAVCLGLPREKEKTLLAYIDEREAMEAATTWRAMDSAPRDRKVWICIRNGAGKLVRAIGRFTDEDDADGWATDCGYYRSVNVLAWFPIPELPPTGLEGGR